MALAALSACNQEEINTNIYGVSDDDLRVGGLDYGTALMDMEQQVIPIGSPSETTGPGNDLQATDLISSGSYIGYFGNNNNWSSNIEASWNFVDGRMDYIYNQLYTDITKPWVTIYKLAKDSQKPSDKRILAIANIVKVMGWLRATDAFGPIVYTQAGSGSITPTPDSQEVVYKGMLKELSEATAVLRDAQVKILPNSDLVYDGDPASWVRLANSLMLRMAVRVHFKDQALAQEYITKATDPANGGLIVQANQVAKVASSSKLPLRSPYLASVDEYKETRMGATIWAYLDGFKDPRNEKLFKEAEDPRIELYGLPKRMPLAPTGSQPKTDERAKASVPRVIEKNEVIWFRASETKFLLAEAALYGLYNNESAQSLYEAGIKLSFEELGASGAKEYYSQEDVKPSELSSALNSIYSSPYSDNISNGNIVPLWDENASQEKKLQRIITQKYIALYPNAIEAWTEYRRTGYPYIMKPQDASAITRIGGVFGGKERTPERFSFPASSYSNNPNLSVIPKLLGGKDEGITKLWWVRDNRPVQQ